MSSIMQITSQGLLGVLSVAFVLALIRLVRGPSLPDRVVAVDLFTTIGVALCGAQAVIHDKTVFLDVAIIIALISFVGTIAFARHIETRSAETRSAEEGSVETAPARTQSTETGPGQ